jgi:hypothetical protein
MLNVSSIGHVRYHWLLNRRHDPVRAVLIAEREPRDTSWRDLCTDLGVELVTPADLMTLLD